ncbi:MAG: 4'-phosphopantetheinyl transferase superfamily protein [Candidatus Acidiferrales bacterium]
MNSLVEWSSVAENPVLESGEIHVWRALLSVEQSLLRHLESTLAEDEKTRAARFIFDRDRDHYVAARGILRDLLSGYIGCPAETIKFAYGPQGKPALADPGSKSSLRFNVSHSHGLALIAVGAGREVGIDVELLRPEFAGEDTAKRYFSVKEVRELTRLPVESRTEAFFRCWTRKEAYIKARGEGLRVPLDSFSVSLSPDRFPELSSADESRWKIESLIPAREREPAYAAAVVAEGKEWTSQYFEWKPTRAQDD